MIKRFLFNIVLCLPLIMESQNWDSIRGGLPNDFIENVLYDSVHNELLVSSKFLKQIGSLPARGVARWNGSRWDSLSSGVNTHDKTINPNQSATITGAIPYNGKLLVAGGFISIGDINATGLALWDGIKWDSLPKRAFRFSPSGGTDLAGIYKANNLVYIYGIFDTIAGQKANGFATWNGVNFTPILLPTGPSYSGVFNLIEYQNELYIAGGNFSSPTYSNNVDVLKFDGSGWISTTGTGLNGFAAGVGPMVIYNNELYAGGHFLITDGNPGNNIMKWNGSQWKDVGFGNSSSFVGIRKLLVHQNKLWAIGCYDKAAGMPTYCVSVYDGVNWCVLQDTVDNCLLSATVYKDTMYIGGGFWNAGGDPHITFLAKLRDPNLYKSCKNVGIKEIEGEKGISIFPNPVSNTLHLEAEQYFEKGTEIEITNILGQTVLSQKYSKEIDVSKLLNGIYILKIIVGKEQLLARFIKYD